MEENHLVTFDELKATYSRYIHRPEDLALIEKAYRFAEKKHEGQFRKSGDPYITHCLGVAKILAELEVGPTTICAGLLHDTIEDTGTTKEEIEKDWRILTMLEMQIEHLSGKEAIELVRARQE